MYNFVVEKTDQVSSSLLEVVLHKRDRRRNKPRVLFSSKQPVFRSPVLDRGPRERILETYSGRIEDIDKDSVYLSLSRDGDFFEGEFATTTFAPGAKIVKGRGTITEKVALPSGYVVWRNRVLPPKVVDPKVLEEMRSQLDAEFGGTGL